MRILEKIKEEVGHRLDDTMSRNVSFLTVVLDDRLEQGFKPSKLWFA
jgi:hypothetical protein